MCTSIPLLSICIPTYNGSKYIEVNIDKILEQIKKHNLKNVEIVVSDNCSTDSIPQIMKKYQKKYPQIIVYSRNDENLGYDGNVMKCCELARGKFIHLFGDDDYYADDGLKKLVSTLNKHPKISVAVLSNFYLRANYFNTICDRKGLNNRYREKDTYYVNKSDNFILDIEDRAWPNTNIVFRKEYFEQIPNLKTFYKKDWIHLYILLYIAAKWQNCYLFADKNPIVIDRVGVQTWLNNKDGPRIYFNNLWTYSFANQLGYHKKVFDWYRRKLLNEYVKNIRYRRSKNTLVNFKYIVKYFKYWYDLPQFYFQFIPKYLRVFSTFFSIENSYSKRHKIITILGLKFKIKRKRKK